MSADLATLASKIDKAEKEVQELKDAIRKGDDAALKALGFTTRDKAADAVARLEERLNTYEKQKLAVLTQQQQQQSGAGTSMLPVRQEYVMLPGQRSCCIHQQTLQLWECVLLFHALSAAACCLCTVRCALER
jgi:hypothetical protein